jgi:hypothetical protein
MAALLLGLFILYSSAFMLCRCLSARASAMAANGAHSCLSLLSPGLTNQCITLNHHRCATANNAACKIITMRCTSTILHGAESKEQGTSELDYPKIKYLWVQASAAYELFHFHSPSTRADTSKEPSRMPFPALWTLGSLMSMEVRTNIL